MIMNNGKNLNSFEFYKSINEDIERGIQWPLPGANGNSNVVNMKDSTRENYGTRSLCHVYCHGCLRKKTNRKDSRERERDV